MRSNDAEVTSPSSQQARQSPDHST
eukprot:ctg_2432.g454